MSGDAWAFDPSLDALTNADLLATLDAVLLEVERRLFRYSQTGHEILEMADEGLVLATGRPGIVCFTGAYHGQSYGALAVTDYPGLGAPFLSQIPNLAIRIPYPNTYRCTGAPACGGCRRGAMRRWLRSRG